MLSRWDSLDISMGLSSHTMATVLGCSAYGIMQVESVLGFFAGCFVLRGPGDDLWLHQLAGKKRTVPASACN